jgi:hypothetical protein
MDESLSEWLRLREAADWAARADRLVPLVTQSLMPRAAVHVLDLCTGTGSNLRYLMGRLPSRQRWLVIDRDPTLLAEVSARLSSWAEPRGFSVLSDATGDHVRGVRLECDVEARQLNVDVLDPSIFEGRHLVTASALLDLVSEHWLTVLAARCRAVGASALFTITYSGRSSCDPVEREDDDVRDLFNRHQRTDKGLGGAAAGPDAWAAAERIFAEAGYLVESAPSDWTLEPTDRAFQRRLIEGWAEAATEVAPERAPAIADWLRRRLDHVSAGRSRIVVGHGDMAAWLPVG